MWFELWKSKDGWRIRLKARNGCILLSSEAYSTKQSALRTLKMLRRSVKLEIREV